MCREAPRTCTAEEFHNRRGAADVPADILLWFDDHRMWPADPERPLLHLRPGELLAPVEEKIGGKWVERVDTGRAGARAFAKRDVQMWSRRDGGRRSVPRGRAWDLIESFANALAIEVPAWVEVDRDTGEIFAEPFADIHEEALDYLLDFYFIQEQGEGADLGLETADALFSQVAGELSPAGRLDLMHYAKLLCLEEGNAGLADRIQQTCNAIKAGNASRLTAIRNTLKTEAAQRR